MLHNALVALATAFSDDHRIRNIKSRRYYVTAAKSYIDDECQSPSISAVHALSLLGGFHSTQGDQTLGYMYFGMSGRISQALGLSIDASPWVEANLITHNDMLDRNWTYWTTFSMDVLWSLYVGREFCVSLPSDRQTIPVPFVDTDFDELPWHYSPSGFPPQPNHLSRTFAKTCELLRIARGIMDVLNVLNSPGTRQDVNHELINQIDAQLTTWKAGLPAEVDISVANLRTATPHRLMLHLTYWKLFILLHRPFYRRIRPSTGLEKDIDHVTLCNTAAQNIMELIGTWKSLYTLRYIPTTFIQVIFAAGTIFLLSAVEATTRSQPIEDLISQAEQCSRYLRETGRSWQSANRVATILSSLLREQLKPKLLRSANQRRLCDLAVSPIIPQERHEGTSPVSSLPDYIHSDWLSTGFMGGGGQMGGHFAVDVTGMNGVFGRMDSNSHPPMGIRRDDTLPSRAFMSFGPTPSLGPLWNPSESGPIDNQLLRFQFCDEQQGRYQESTANR
jgi:hypothetical protein